LKISIFKKKPIENSNNLLEKRAEACIVDRKGVNFITGILGN